MEKSVPIPIIYRELPKEMNPVYIIPIYDCHIGDPGFDEEALQGYINWVLARENAFVILGGDILDSPTRHNKASEYWDMVLKPEEALQLAVKLLKPLAPTGADEGRILGVVDGNHEYRVFNSTGHSPTERLMDMLHIPMKLYDHEVIIVKLGFGDDKSSNNRFFYDIYVTHGWGGARKTGGQVNKAEELSNVVPDADIYLTGHEHTLFCSRWEAGFIPRSASAKHPTTMRQVFLGCGCFCRVTRFLKRIQRRLPVIGAPRIRLEGISSHRGYRDIHVSL